MPIDVAKYSSLDFLPANLRDFMIRRLPAWVILFLVLLLSYQLAGFVWQIYGLFKPSSPATSISSAAQGQTRPAPAASQDYGFLSGLHLFGKMDEKGPQIEETPVTAPETNLNLTLYGVFSADDVKQGAAIIGTKVGEQKFYRVDDKVTTGVWLAEVRKDHVLLKRGAGFEVLKFPKNPDAGMIVNQVSTPPTLPVTGAKQTLMENIRIVPVFAGQGKGLKGYRLLPKKNRAVYNKLGVRPSDIVTEINGIPLSNEQEAMRVIGELMKADRVEVKLLRGGKVESLAIQLN